jgi:hypothetical protein
MSGLAKSGEAAIRSRMSRAETSRSCSGKCFTAPPPLQGELKVRALRDLNA